MIITIYGASDDLIEVEGCKGGDEYTSYEEGPLMWHGDLIAPDGGQMRVHAIHDGCWHFSVGQVDEDVLLPSWPLTIAQRERAGGFPSYTVELTIDAPEGTRLTNVWPTRT